MIAPCNVVDELVPEETPTLSQVSICLCCNGYQYAGPLPKRSDWLNGSSLIAIKQALLRKYEEPNGGSR